VPTTPDLAVVNCEPTVRVAFDILLLSDTEYLVCLFGLSTFADRSIVGDTYDIVKGICHIFRCGFSQSLGEKFGGF
jgi:hypothetical protein